MAFKSRVRPLFFLFALSLMRFRLPELRTVFLGRPACFVAGLPLARLSEIDDLAHQVSVAKAAAS
jgi:hypothetical protein